MYPLDSVNNTLNGSLNHCIFNGQEHLCDIFYGLVRFTAVVSMLSCFFIFFTIWVFRLYLVFAQRQILYLAVSVFLISVSSMTSISPPGHLCTFKGWAHTIFYWMEIAWICCITFNLYMNAVHDKLTDKYEWAYHLVSWGLTFLVCMIPIIFGKYGPAGLWCSISGTWEWRFGIWYLPRYTLIVALFITYIYTIIAVNRKVKSWTGLYDPRADEEKKLLKEYIKPLRAYPVVYLAVSVFPLINRLQNAISSERIFALFLLQGVTANLHGVLNAIVYYMEMRSKLTLDQIKVALLSRVSGGEEHKILEYPTHDAVTSPPPPLPHEPTVHM